MTPVSAFIYNQYNTWGGALLWDNATDVISCGTQPANSYSWKHHTSAVSIKGVEQKWHSNCYVCCSDRQTCLYASTHTHTHTDTQTHRQTVTDRRTNIPARAYTHKHASMYTHIRTDMHTHTLVRVRMHTDTREIKQACIIANTHKYTTHTHTPHTHRQAHTVGLCEK